MKYRDLAPKLFDNGWRNVIPLTNGKAPVFKWGPIQHRDMTDETLDYLVRRFGFAPRVGIVFGECRKLVAVDIDIENEASLREVLNVAEQYLPPTDYLRIGKPPKRLMLYRGSVRSVKPHPIEIFSSSGQIAAFGPHPSTGRDYVWPLASIFECGPEDLPEVTQAQIDAFLAHCKRDVTPRDVMGRAINWSDFPRLANERRMYGVDAAARQVMNIKDGNRHLVLLSVTGWLVSKGYTPEDIGVFVDNLFPHQLRVDDWIDPLARAEDMAEMAIEKWGDTDWDLKDE